MIIRGEAPGGFGGKGSRSLSGEPRGFADRASAPAKHCLARPRWGHGLSLARFILRVALLGHVVVRQWGVEVRSSPLQGVEPVCRSGWSSLQPEVHRGEPLQVGFRIATMPDDAA